MKQLPMHRCVSCKHYDAHRYGDAFGDGVCALITDSSSTAKGVPILMGWEAEALLVPPDFGCSLWESKEEGGR